MLGIFFGWSADHQALVSFLITVGTLLNRDLGSRMPVHPLTRSFRLTLFVSIMDIVGRPLACQETNNQVWPEVDVFADLNS